MARNIISCLLYSVDNCVRGYPLNSFHYATKGIIVLLYTKYTNMTNTQMYVVITNGTNFVISAYQLYIVTTTSKAMDIERKGTDIQILVNKSDMRQF